MHTCRQCGHPAPFCVDGHWYCTDHWRLTDYAIALTIDQRNRIIEEDEDDDDTD